MKSKMMKIEFYGSRKQAEHLELVIKTFLTWEQLANAVEMTDEMIDIFNEIVGNEVLFKDEK